MCDLRCSGKGQPVDIVSKSKIADQSGKGSKIVSLNEGGRNGRNLSFSGWKYFIAKIIIISGGAVLAGLVSGALMGASAGTTAVVSADLEVAGLSARAASGAAAIIRAPPDIIIIIAIKYFLPK